MPSAVDNTTWSVSEIEDWMREKGMANTMCGTQEVHNSMFGHQSCPECQKVVREILEEDFGGH